jgi:hypothetical protein
MHDTSTRFRALAVVLAVAGTASGLFCGWFIIYGDTIRSILIFSPGYAATLGYFWRAIYPPDTVWRRVIWGWSAPTQGAWLAFFAVGVAIGGGPFPVVPLVWWLCAFAISAYGLVSDRDDLSGVPDELGSTQH